ncbi:hypothetical protein NCCP2716_18860 [Sporosarcina sp. NCCP-2716]|uniref:hypothetical protein n=1 Tax=Sporosarcina sp. NCCP-2716 TaxID=2943679 RepID=UPI00203ADB00|nr:hypothetical protein [Sporosarcina sp. NCCP-2716]GKV69388.1 hypothetical protein NCCP2716_18860 [Sporosarcina sp. NCCP-2716]
MDQTQMLRELLNTTQNIDISDEILSDLIIVSTLLGEVVLTGILFREYELFENFNDDTTTTACEKAEFNRSVGEMLKGACCLENAFVRKIEAATELKRVAAGTDEPVEPETGGCCRVRR